MYNAKVFVASSLPHVADRQKARVRPARASSMVLGSFRCLQTKPETNILFAVCRVLDNTVADLFIFAAINGENPVTESGPKILTVKLGSYTLIFLEDFWPAYSIGP